MTYVSSISATKITLSYL